MVDVSLVLMAQSGRCRSKLIKLWFDFPNNIGGGNNVLIATADPKTFKHLQIQQTVDKTGLKLMQM